MLCDELKEYTNPTYGSSYYDIDEVDAAIAELKEFAENACIERDDNQTAIDELQAENAELKQKLEDVQASHYADMVDAGMRERKMKRALWLTRALRARDIQRWWLQVTCSPRTEVACRKWNNVERKCREKAEED